METQTNSESTNEQLSMNNANPTESADNGGEVEVTEEQKLQMLKDKATMMGIAFSNNIKAETLIERIRAKMEGAEPAKEESEVTAAETPAAPNPVLDANQNSSVSKVEDGSVKKTAPVNERERLKREAMKLIRVRIANLDPKKKDLSGEIITVANDILGTVRMFVPYGEVTDDGWHIPNWIYKHLEKRKFLHIRTSKDRATGQQKVEHFYAKEFSIEVLPPLTEGELADLAKNQAAAGSIQKD